MASVCYSRDGSGLQEGCTLILVDMPKDLLIYENVNLVNHSVSVLAK